MYSFLLGCHYFWALLVDRARIYMYIHGYMHTLCSFLKRFYLSIYLREREREKRKREQGEEQREKDKQTPCWVQSLTWAWSHDPEIMSCANIKSRMRNWLSYSLPSVFMSVWVSVYRFKAMIPSIPIQHKFHSCLPLCLFLTSFSNSERPLIVYNIFTYLLSSSIT